MAGLLKALSLLIALFVDFRRERMIELEVVDIVSK